MQIPKTARRPIKVCRLGANPLAMLMMEKRTISIIKGHLLPYRSAKAPIFSKRKRPYKGGADSIYRKRESKISPYQIQEPQ
jgi:hypothetical protein